MKFQNKEEIEPELKKHFDSLKSVKIKRNLETAAKNRAAYIAEVEKLAVSKPVHERLTLQNHIKRLIGTGKERFAMTPTFISIVMAFVLFFGGSGISVAAAQNSLPDDILYPVKLLTEDIKEVITTQPGEKLDLEMDLSQTRLEEIGTLLKSGDLPEDTVLTRLQNHLMTAFQLAAETNPQDTGEMLRLQNRLHEQIQIMDQLQISENTPADAILLRTRDMLQTQIRLVDNSLVDPGTTESEIPDQDRIQNQNLNQDMTQNQNQDMDQNQNQNQDMTQNQNQDMDQNQNQDSIQNQNLELEQNANSNQGMQNNSGNDNSAEVENDDSISNSSGKGSGGGGSKN